MEYTIHFPTKEKFLKQINPKTFRDAAIAAINDVGHAATKKTNTQVKRKFNIVMKNDGDKYHWVAASKIDGMFSSRGGRTFVKYANKSNMQFKIHIDGSPINDSRFEVSHAQEILATKGLKKQGAAVKRMKRERKKGDLKRPRTKILAKGLPKHLGAAFFATMPNKHSGIFRKKGKKIIELRTITLPSMYKQVDFDEILSSQTDNYLDKRFWHYYERIAK